MVLMLLSGCSGFGTNSSAHLSPTFEAGHYRPDEAFKKQLARVLETTPPQHITVNMEVPYTENQMNTYQNSLWMTRADRLRQLLRSYGVSNRQINIVECVSCQNLNISF